MKRIVMVILLIINITGFVSSDEYEKTKELLMPEKGGDILYLSKINFGILEASSWIVNRGDGWTRIYIVDSEWKLKRIWSGSIAEQSELMRHWDRNTGSWIDLKFDIMRDIPGTRLGNKTAMFGDYNGDGKDEIFVFSSAIEDGFYMLGYDIEKDEIATYIDTAYDITDPNGLPPVEFIKYQGIDGIKVGVIPFRENRYVWRFFAWNEESQEYIEIAEIDTTKSLQEQNNQTEHLAVDQTAEEAVKPEPLAVIERENQIEAAKTITDEASSSRFPLLVLIAIIGAVVVVGAVLFIVKRKKRRRTR